MSAGTKVAPDAPAKPKTLLDGALAQAAQVEPRKETGDHIAGPFDVGNVGKVEVRAHTRGTHTTHVGVFHPAGGGKTQRMPLAAIAALTEGLGA